jgi:hypothetical protein
MNALFLLPESVARQDGSGAEIALETKRRKPLLLTLGITRAMEQESLEISIWGSSDQKSWEPLQVFPQKFYCGTYSMPLDLNRRPDIHYLRAQWKMNRWGSACDAPLFGFYLSMEEPTFHAVGA